MGQIQIAIVVLGLTGFFFAILLAFLSKKLKVEEDPRVAKVLDVLPGLNCGACGFSGCRPFADAVVHECNMFDGCLPGGSEINSKISEHPGGKRLHPEPHGRPSHVLPGIIRLTFENRKRPEHLLLQIPG